MSFLTKGRSLVDEHLLRIQVLAQVEECGESCIYTATPPRRRSKELRQLIANHLAATAAVEEAGLIRRPTVAEFYANWGGADGALDHMTEDEREDQRGSSWVLTAAGVRRLAAARDSGDDDLMDAAS